MTTIAFQALADALGRYPELGQIHEIVANGLSVNTATCLVACAHQTVLAKRFPLSEFDPDATRTQHLLIRHLIARGFPTPPVIANVEGQTVTIADDGAWVLFERALGEDRYQGTPVFDPFFSLADTSAAGRMLARFHLALADFPTPGGPEDPLPRGIIHGDFIKRNLFWQGHEVSAVIDLDLWKVAPWIHDLAMSLLPVGFDWPHLLQGVGVPRMADMRAFLAGYAEVRPLTDAERQVLPTLMETVRVPFYLDLIALWERRGRPEKAQAFRTLLTGTQSWFRDHPDWALGLI